MTQPKSSEQTIQTLTSTEIVPITSAVAPWLTPILYPLARFVVLPFYFGRIEITGQENLPTDGPVILAPTHRARWDAIVVPHATGRSVTGRDLRFMVSANEIKGLQGWFIRRAGGFPVDTDRPGIGSFRHGVELLLDGEMMVIFPEGNIFRNNRVNPLKRGLARIALQAESMQPGLNVKIVPISLKYSQPVPQWGCDIKIIIGTPLQTANYDTKSIKRSTIKLTDDLETALKQLDEKNALVSDNMIECTL